MTEKALSLTLEVMELRLELAAAQTSRNEWKAEAMRLRKERGQEVSHGEK